MRENSGDFAFDYMHLREIIFFHEKVEKLNSQYDSLRKVNVIALMHVHQEIILDTEKVIDLYAGQNRQLNLT